MRVFLGAIGLASMFTGALAIGLCDLTREAFGLSQNEGVFMMIFAGAWLVFSGVAIMATALEVGRRG